jgi:Queuosine salvage protein
MRRVFVVDAVREASARISAEATHVRIEHDRLERYAGELPRARPGHDPEAHYLEGAREDRAAFFVTLDAVNFGSGWWPTIRKRPGASGYFTLATGLAERFRTRGPWTARELAAIDAGELAATLGQDPAHELLALYAASLADLGERVERLHGGSFAALVDAAGGSAVQLVESLAAWPSFLDVSVYGGREAPFYKRAQLLAADLEQADAAEFADLGRLTVFADNVVPHVLRVDGVLRYDPVLAARIDAGEPIEHGSPEEVELRACAVHAGELLAGLAELTPAEVDGALWNKGRGAVYKERPRHRSRGTGY